MFFVVCDHAFNTIFVFFLHLLEIGKERPLFAHFVTFHLVFLLLLLARVSQLDESLSVHVECQFCRSRRLRQPFQFRLCVLFFFSIKNSCVKWLVSNEEPKLGPKLFVSFLKRMFKSTKKLTSTFVFRTCARSRSVLSMEAASTASAPSVFMYATCCVADRSPNCAVESSAIILLLLLLGVVVDI